MARECVINTLWVCERFEPLQERKSGKSSGDKRLRLDDDDDDELPEVPVAGAIGDDGWGDESGYRWLIQLQQYISDARKPNPYAASSSPLRFDSCLLSFR